MKICGGNTDMDAKFALNPAVSPFIPRSVTSKNVHPNVFSVLDTCDIFKWDDICSSSDESYIGWSFSRLCGLDLPSENGEKLLGSNEAEFFRQTRMEPAGGVKPCQLLSAAFETKAQSFGSSCIPSVYNDLVTNVVDTATEAGGAHQQNQVDTSKIRCPSGSKVLDGIWASSTRSNAGLEPCSPSQGSSTLPCQASSHSDYTSSGLDCGTYVSTIDMFKTVNQSNSKSGNEGCYTLFGDDRNDGPFGCSPPKADPPQAVSTEKSYSLWGSSNEENLDDQNKYDYSFWRNGEASTAVKNAQTLPGKRIDQSINVAGNIGRQSSLKKGDQDSWPDLPYFQKNIATEVNSLEYTVGSKPEAYHSAIHNSDIMQQSGFLGHLIDKSGMKTSETHLPFGMPSVLTKPVGDQQAPALSAEQQFFLSELERLPPLLRQQYLDFMTAKQQLGALAAFPYPYVCSMQPVGAMCHVDFASPSVPQAYPKSKTMQPVMLMPKPVQSYGGPLPLFSVPAQVQQSAKTVKRTGPANELHAKLEECYEQFRLLENERKKTEAELARQNPGKMISSDNDCPLPQLPHNPSRIDRLVLDSMREHARVFKLVTKMMALRGSELSELMTECLANWMESTSAVESCRREEIINAINRHRAKNVTSAQKETDVMALASSLKNLTDSLRSARSALWCALQLASNDLPQKCVEVARQYAKRRVDPIPANNQLSATWEYPVNQSPVQQRMPRSSFITRFVDEYEDDVFTDTEEELNAAC